MLLTVLGFGVVSTGDVTVFENFLGLLGSEVTSLCFRGDVASSAVVLAGA